MNEKHEINLLEAQKEWQAKQNVSGVLAMGLCVATVMAFFFFVNVPGVPSMVVLLALMMALMSACARMIGCAAKVVEIRTAHNALKPAHHATVDSEVIDVEVIDSASAREYQRMPKYV